MSTFVQVAGENAGPEALGILVPPGKRTLVVARPRSLSWDLVCAEKEDRFREMARPEAVQMAETLVQTLRESTSLRVKVVAARNLSEYWIRVESDRCSLLLCDRSPGQPYRPAAFRDIAEARSAAEQVTAILVPSGEQELYVNLNQFSR